MKFTLFLAVANLFSTVLGLSCTIFKFEDVPVAIEFCDVLIFDTFTVPNGKTLELILRPGTRVIFNGTLTFGYEEWNGPLVQISGTGVSIEGNQGHTFIGQGELYWDGLGEWGSVKPLFFHIELHNSIMENMHIKNSPRQAVLLTNSTDVELRRWNIDNADGDPKTVGVKKSGHNTDGFDIWNTTNLLLYDGNVHNQDDCVALRSGANIVVDFMTCTEGHGLSISVGFSNNSEIENTLENVTIRYADLIGGENAIHIKTHVDGGLGRIKNVTYTDIKFSGQTKFGINIQQNYRNVPPNDTTPIIEPKDNIPIVDLKFSNIKGSVDNNDDTIPIYILCAENACVNWKFMNVSVQGNQTKNECNYVPENFSCNDIFSK